MNKLLLVLFIPLLFPLLSNAQNEPATNIGKSLIEMKVKFPELRFLEHTTNGDNYQDGYTKDGISIFFTFKGNRVISESLMVESNDGFAKEWYEELKEGMIPGVQSVYNERDIHQLYSTFTCHLYFTVDFGKYCTSLYYFEGGWKNGISGSDFYNAYKK